MTLTRLPFVAAALVALACAPALAQDGLPLPKKRLPYPIPIPGKQAPSNVRLTIYTGDGAWRHSRQVRVDLRTGQAELWTTSDLYRKVREDRVDKKTLIALRAALDAAGLDVEPQPIALYANHEKAGKGRGLARHQRPDYSLTVDVGGRQLTVSGGPGDLARNPGLAKAIAILRRIEKQLQKAEKPEQITPEELPEQITPEELPEQITPEELPEQITPEELPEPKPPLVKRPFFPDVFPNPFFRWLADRVPAIPSIGFPGSGVLAAVFDKIRDAYEATAPGRKRIAERIDRLSESQLASAARSLGRAVASKVGDVADAVKSGAEAGVDAVKDALGERESKGMTGRLEAQ